MQEEQQANTEAKLGADTMEELEADTAAEVAVHEPTEAELMNELEAALKSKDFKAVAAASRKLDTAVKAKEKAELAVKQEALDAIKGKVAGVITKALKPMIESGELDAADGIWYSFDFGETEAVVRLSKTAPKAARAGGSTGGGGKKFDVSTDDMLSRHGSKEYKDGMTFQAAYESNTDKNWRYAIRQKLLKLDGVI